LSTAAWDRVGREIVEVTVELMQGALDEGAVSRRWILVVIPVDSPSLEPRYFDHNDATFIHFTDLVGQSGY